MYKILLFFFTVISINALAQPQLIKQRCMGYKHSENFEDVILNNDGTFWATMAAADSVPEFANKPFLGATVLMKFDTALNLLDVKYFGGSNGASRFYRIVKDSKNNELYCFGVTLATNGDCVGGSGNPNGDIFVVKTDSNGNKIWSRCYNTNGGSSAASLLPVCDNSVVLGLYVQYAGGIVPTHYGGFSDDAALMRIDSAGNLKWVRTMGGSGADFLEPENLLPMDNCSCRGNITTYSADHDLSGSIGTTDSLKNWMFVVDSSGQIIKQNIEREYLYRANNGYYRSHIVKYKNNQTLLIGAARADSYYNPTYPAHKNDEGVVAIYDSNLTLKSMKLFGGTGDDDFFNYCKDNEGNYYFAGTSSSHDGDLLGCQAKGNFWIMKTDSNFNWKWSRKFGGDKGSTFSNAPINIYIVGSKLYFWAYALSTPILPDGDVQCGHYAYSPSGTLEFDAWVAVFDLNTKVGIEIPEPMQNNQFEVYPNPTSKILTIKSIQSLGDVTCRIMLTDLRGRLVYKEKVYQLTETTLDVSNYTAGTYILTIESKGNKLYTNKIIINP